MSVEVKEVMDAVASMDAEVKAFIEKANAESEEYGKLGRENSKALADLNAKAEEMSDRLLDLVQQRNPDAAALAVYLPAALVGGALSI